MLTEVYRERISVASTLLVTMLLTFALFFMQAGVRTIALPASAAVVMTDLQMSDVVGEGPIAIWGGLAAVAVGVTLVAVAVACVANPVVGAIVISGLLGSGISVSTGAAIVGGAGLLSGVGGALGLKYQKFLP